MSDATKEQSIEEGIADVARQLAEHLPGELLTRILKAKLNESLNDLNRSYGPNNLKGIVERAVEKKVDELLTSSEFEPRVTEIATRLANEALVLAKEKVGASVKPKRGY